MSFRRSADLLVPAGRTLGQHFVDLVSRGLAGESLDQSAGADSIDSEIEPLRRTCRDGNPFPLVAYQWPELVIDDPGEIAIFASHLRPERFAALTRKVRDACLDPSNPPLRLDWWQRIIIAAYFDDAIQEIYIKGCAGAGKGGAVSMGFCLLYDVEKECRISLTSRDFDHTITGIFGETKMWFERMKSPAVGSVLNRSIEESPRHYIHVLNPGASSQTAGEKFSGAHGAKTVYGFDENTSHPQSFMENAQKNARKIIALANPRHRLGPFYRAFEKLGLDKIDSIGVCYGTIGNRLCLTVGGMDCMNVAEGRLKVPIAPAGGIEIKGQRFEQGKELSPEAIKACCPLIPNQVDLAQFKAALVQFLPECFAHGRFPQEDPEKQVILMSWLARHEEAWRACNGQFPVTCFGLDVARSLKGDRTVLAAGSDKGMAGMHQMQFDDIMLIVDEVVRIAAANYGINLLAGQNPISIDYGGGYGSGVGDVMRKRRIWVIEFQPGGAAEVLPRVYANLRAEGYALLGARLDPANQFGAMPWMLPTIEGLREELTAPEKQFASDLVRFKIAPKEEIKQLLGKSPDLADAATYLFHAVRTFYLWNDFFLRAAAPLVVYPAPADIAAREAAKHGEPQPPVPSHPILDWFQSEYGKVAESADPTTPEDAKRRAERIYREAVAAGAAKPENGNGSGNGNGNCQSWVDRVRWGDRD